jgi:hypothetical protein
MIVSDITIAQAGDRHVVSASVRLDKRRETRRVDYAFTGVDPAWLSTSGDAWVAAGLQPAMALGEPLVIEAPVSPALLARVPVIMDILTSWDSALRRVDVVAPAAPAAAPVARRTNLFFSLGVDSFYSLLKNVDRHPVPDPHAVSHLTFTTFGFDHEWERARLFPELRGRVHAVASAVKTDVIVVETNAPSLGEGLVTWSFYHGASLAAIALLLGDGFSRSLVASTHAYQELVPWGSHPLLDPMWSTEEVAIVHDGCEALRTEKIAYLGAHPLALDNLRVCWNHDSLAYNCGVCEKCLRTMVALHIAGALDRCSTFAEPLALRNIRRMQLATGESSIRFFEDLLLALGPSDDHRRLAKAIKGVLRTYRIRTGVGRFVRRYLGEGATLAAVRSRLVGGGA